MARDPGLHRIRWASALSQAETRDKIVALGASPKAELAAR